MTSFGIENAEAHAEQNDLVKYDTLQCLCSIHELGINNCKNCNGTGLLEVPIYPQEFVLELPSTFNIAGEDVLLSVLLKALGLKGKYGETYARQLLPRINKWKRIRSPGQDSLALFNAGPICKDAAYYVPSTVYELKEQLTNICNEAEKREEKVIWG